MARAAEAERAPPHMDLLGILDRIAAACCGGCDDGFGTQVTGDYLRKCCVFFEGRGGGSTPPTFSFLFFFSLLVNLFFWLFIFCGVRT